MAEVKKNVKSPVLWLEMETQLQIGGNAHASTGGPGEINRRQYNSNAMLNQMEREFIEGMRRYGRLSDWAECFDILENAKLKQLKTPIER